jgi:hypothetical protein
MVGLQPTVKVAIIFIDARSKVSKCGGKNRGCAFRAVGDASNGKHSTHCIRKLHDFLAGIAIA